MSGLARAAIAKLCRRIVEDPTRGTTADLVKIAKAFLMITGEKL